MHDSIVLLPSPNSAFTRPVPRLGKRVFPSAPICKKLLFGGSDFRANDLKVELREAMQNRQNAFADRWKYRCDIIVCNCDGNQVEKIKQEKIPKVDWIPIDPLSEDEDELLCFSEESVLNRINRPGAPLPFHCTNNSLVTPIPCKSNTNINVDENKENKRFCTFVAPLTPPSSPEHNESDVSRVAPLKPIPLKNTAETASKISSSQLICSANRQLLDER